MAGDIFPSSQTYAADPPDTDHSVYTMLSYIKQRIKQKTFCKRSLYKNNQRTENALVVFIGHVPATIFIVPLLVELVLCIARYVTLLIVRYQCGSEARTGFVPL